MAKKEQQKSSPNSINLIANTTEFKGDLKTSSDIKFDGKLEGTLVSDDRLLLGENGYIKGDVKCKNAVISGTIEGKIIVEELIKLESTAKIQGELITSKLAIEPGAILDGTCTMAKKNNNSQALGEE